jgi:glutamate carboxypeptidase
LRFISSPNEETGSPGFKEMLKEMSSGSFMALGFEPALDEGAIITGRKGVRWYQIDVKGRDAHAGRNHRFGVNAGVELAGKISK